MRHKQMMFYSDKRAAASFCIIDLLCYPFTAIRIKPSMVVFVFIVIKAQHSHFFGKCNNKANRAYFCGECAYCLLRAEIGIKLRQIIAFHNRHIVINRITLKSARIFIAAPIMCCRYQINRLAFLKFIKFFAKFNV